ncbi:hypothetical protein AB0J82_36695 [Asanoa sp. NPDC049518]|uniref:hypothetical protein n=1 Tax=unclassified Asanoa TaxID=2685164 RepID=UPI003420416F
MLLTLGFTESDPDANYLSYTAGYIVGIRQTSITIVLEGDGRAFTAEQWAQAAFVACNHPHRAPSGPARAIQLALAGQARWPLRSLSVGDTVTVHGQMWTCDAQGWQQVGERPHDFPTPTEEEEPSC